MEDLVKMTIDFVDNFDINSIPEDVKNSWIESYTRTYSKKAVKLIKHIKF